MGTGIPVSVITGNSIENEGLDQGPGVGHGNYSQVTVGPQGDIYVIEGPGNANVYHSTDGGASFTLPNEPAIASSTFDGHQPIPASTLTNDQFRTVHIYGIAADPTRPGYVYAVATVASTSANGTTLAQA